MEKVKSKWKRSERENAPRRVWRKTQPLKEVEKYIEGSSDSATLDADSHAMRECFRSRIHLRRG